MCIIIYIIAGCIGFVAIVCTLTFVVVYVFANLVELTFRGCIICNEKNGCACDEPA